ncbi:hypothetical protein NL676_034453 [Syzygium grande]|nr:hypothetical protein NL676_034453 [Syzygium grande]
MRLTNDNPKKERSCRDEDDGDARGDVPRRVGRLQRVKNEEPCCSELGAAGVGRDLEKRGSALSALLLLRSLEKKPMKQMTPRMCVYRVSLNNPATATATTRRNQEEEDEEEEEEEEKGRLLDAQGRKQAEKNRKLYSLVAYAVLLLYA